MIAHNIRSAYNIGGIFRTADGAGASNVYLTGYSPFPTKLGAIYKTSAQKMISKTALGAEETLAWKRYQSLTGLIEKLRKEGWTIIALEQDARSISLKQIQASEKLAIIVGNEPKGLDQRTLQKCDSIVEIPMYGIKNSLNVVVALGVAGYALRDI